MIKDRPIKRFDIALLAAAIALTAIGFTAIYSTAGQAYLVLQLRSLGIALACCVALCILNYRLFRFGHWLTYWLALLMLGSLLFKPGSGVDAMRWIEIAGVRLQPSEFAKVAVALGVAHLLAFRWTRLDAFFLGALGLAYMAAPWALVYRMEQFRTPGIYLAAFFFGLILALWIWRLVATVGRPGFGTIDLIFVVAMYIGAPMVLIFLQPDLGTALVFGAVFFGALFVGAEYFNALDKLCFSFLGVMGMTAPWALMIARSEFRVGAMVAAAVVATALSAFLMWRLWRGRRVWGALDISATVMLVAAAVLTAAVVVGPRALKPYQVQRLTAFMNPDADPRGANYHLNQSMIAVGSGGLWGKGLFLGTQSQLQFIPAQHTDFIFSAIAEEFGFVGSVGVLAAFGLLLWRGLSIAYKSDDRFGGLLAAVLVCILLFHVVINVGMTMGLMPITGLPLPFISFGGSSLITNFAIVGLLESIAMNGKNDERYSV